MKILVLAALSLVALNVHAAAPQLIAKSITSGGMGGPNPRLCLNHEVSLYSDGQVIVTECGKKAEVVLTLAKTQTSTLAALAKASDASGSTFGPLEPGQMHCNDAQSTLIYLNTPKGLEKIGGTEECVKVQIQWQDRMMHPEQTAINQLEPLVALVETIR